MDKLDTAYNGGEPFVLNDLKFMQAGLGDAIKGLASFYGNIGDPVIISGLVGTVAGTNTNFTAGYIVANSEVYFVPAGSISNTGGYMGIDIAQTTDSEGDKIYENGDSHSCFIVRRGALTTTNTGTSIDLTDLRDVKQLIASYGFVLSKATAWANPTFLNSWVNEGSLYAASPLRYRKNEIGNVEIEGAVLNSNVASLASGVFTLPVGFRPPGNKRFIVMGTRNGSSYVAAQVVVFSNGSVNVYGHSVSDAVTFSFDGISFSTT